MSYNLISDNKSDCPRTGVESPRKTVHESRQLSWGSCACVAHTHRHHKNSQSSCKSLSQYVIKENTKKFCKTLGKNFEMFSTSFSHLPLVEKLDELVQKEVTAYKKNSRQRCFKCRKYGHIAKECDKVCKQCFYYHQGKICIINLIQNIQEVLAFNYKNFISFYDKTVESINNLNKSNFYNVSVTSCPSLTIEPSQQNNRKQPTMIKHKELIGKISEIDKMMMETYNGLINSQMRDYAQSHNIALDKIEKVKKQIPYVKEGIAFDVNCRFTKYNIFQKLGSRFSAKCEIYIHYHENQNLYYDKENVYRIVEKLELPPEPVFEIRENTIKSKFAKRNNIQLSRFNKMLRLYTTQDELEQKKQEIEVVQQQLDKMREDIEEQCFDYIINKEQYDEKMKALKNKYKDIKTNLIQETRKLKQKNFNKLNEVRNDCIVAAKVAKNEKTRKIIQHIARTEAKLATDNISFLIGELANLLYQHDSKKIKFMYTTEEDKVVNVKYYNNEKSDQYNTQLRFRQYIDVPYNTPAIEHPDFKHDLTIYNWLKRVKDFLSINKKNIETSKAQEKQSELYRGISLETDPETGEYY